jgi:hypothetical protein
MSLKPPFIQKMAPAHELLGRQSRRAARGRRDRGLTFGELLAGDERVAAVEVGGQRAAADAATSADGVAEDGRVHDAAASWFGGKTISTLTLSARAMRSRSLAVGST